MATTPPIYNCFTVKTEYTLYTSQTLFHVFHLIVLFYDEKYNVTIIYLLK